MHVRYLQHKNHGTVQLLLMPLSATASSTKGSKWPNDRLPSAEDDVDELESVPLPIQTFLWRQTNPFLGAKIAKLQEASCVTFERVVVQNILHGLSPSLSDAITSVSRWRFVRAAFPHVVQCFASLLSDMCNRKGREPISNSLIKILYIMHWLILDSANECNDSDSGKSIGGMAEASVPSHRQYAFSINSIQLFVYLVTPYAHLLTPDDILSHIRLESGLKIWQALWQYRQPEVLCFCAPVKQRKSQLPFINLVRKCSHSATQGIYVGNEEELKRPIPKLSTTIRPPPLVQMTATQPKPEKKESPIPPPKPPRTDRAVLSSLKKRREKELNLKKEQQKKVEDSSVPKSPDDAMIVPKLIFNEVTPCVERRRPATMVRSVSEYHTNEVEDHRDKITRSNTADAFDVSPSLSKGLEELDEAMRKIDEVSLSGKFEFSSRAPLAHLQEICSGISADVENLTQANGCEVICAVCNTVVYRNGTVMGVCKCERRQSTGSMFHVIPRNTATENTEKSKDAKAAEESVEMKEITVEKKPEILVSAGPSVYPPQPPAAPIPKPKICVEDSCSIFYDAMSGLNMGTQQPMYDPQEATYMDVSVIRCLLIKNWLEEGVYWALRYLINRLTEIEAYRCAQENYFRSRANSAPSVPLNKSSTQDSELRQGGIESSHRLTTWDDLQLNEKTKNYDPRPTLTKHKVFFGGETETKRRSLSALESGERTLNVVSNVRRNSTLGTSSTPKVTKPKFDRNKSDPSLSNLSEMLNRDARNESAFGLSNQMRDDAGSKQFFPEALGSSNFIEKNGQVSFNVILSAVNLVVNQWSSIRICELVLNICESLLAMPGADYQCFFDEIIKTVLRIYFCLGCPHGCNEGFRNAQGDFLRVKARTIFATMHRIDAEAFSRLIVVHILALSTQTLVDTMHSITGFCRADISTGAARPRSNSSPRRKPSNADNVIPTYRNHFNEKLKGIEGIIINMILKSVVSRLMKTTDELLQPENMSLYQDVRLFVSFIQEHHGNPFRRVGLSALLDGRPSEPQPGTSSASLDVAESRSDVSDEGSARISPSTVLAPQSHTRDQPSLRRGLFKKREKSSNAEDSDADSSPSTPRNASAAEEGTTMSSSTSPLLPTHWNKKKSGSKLHFAFSLLKSVRAEDKDDEGSDSELNDDGISQDGLSNSEVEHRCHTPARHSLSRAPPVRQRSSTSVDSAEESQEQPSTKRSLTLLHLPPQKIVNLRGIREGVRRFSFLLETCRPGTFPDPPLLAALLDLKSPVLARAALILECAHFVHRCNKGEWPEWIRSGSARHLSILGFSKALGNRGTPSATRRMHMMQRVAGRCFYHWGRQVGDRLKKLMEKDETCKNKPMNVAKLKASKKQLRLYDDIEDFFDESIVNDQTGEACPQALRLLACLLLSEITAFLRETFQTIPRSRTTKTTTGPAGWERLMSHRRWSILSNTFIQNQTTGSIQSIADHPDRRISFSTADDESTPRGSHETIDETGLHDKKTRRLAQGRQRLLRRGSPGQLESSTKRKSQSSFKTRKQSRLPGVFPAVGPNISGVVSGSQGAHFDGEREEFSEPKKDGSQRKRRASSVRIPGWSFRTSVQKTTSTDADGHLSRGDDGTLHQLSSPDHTTSHEKLGVADSCPSSAAGSASKTGGPLHPSPNTYDEEEEQMFSQLPWIELVVEMANASCFDCKHEKFCKPWCFDRVYRQCYRLTEALRKVYGDDLPEENLFDKRKALIESWTTKQDARRKSVHRLSSHVPRRESAAVRSGALMDKTPMALRGLLMEKLSEIEECKEAKAKKGIQQDTDDMIQACQMQPKVQPALILSYISSQVLNIAHAPLSALLKAYLILKEEQSREIIPVAWQLLTHADCNLASTAASLFILSAVRRSEATTEIMTLNLAHPDASIRTSAIRRFYALWRNRFHVWLKMEDGAQLNFKVPPPSIDFTLPSPPIGQSQNPVVDPPWMPHVKTKVEELSLKEEEQATSQTIMTMTRTRRKQKQEMVRKAVIEAEEKQCLLRQKFPLRATAVIQQAAYEPALFHHQATTQMNAEGSGEEADGHPSSTRQQMPVAQPLLPSSLLAVVPSIIEMLDDVQVDSDGISVSDVAKKVIWSCICEDPALFLRHFLEKLTNRDRQSTTFDFHSTSRWEYLMSLLRKLILRFRPIPNQTAYTLLNYLFGFVMFYVRSPCEGSDRAIGMALSITWLVAPNVHGLYFKDLKQTLKKEQCDQALMITANVPSAKKIIVHGPDSGVGGIPAQFPIHEDTQFQQLLTDSLEFFNIPENEVGSYFLVDTKTNLVHVPTYYVRDFYFFHRSFYPQISLMKIDVDEAHLRMRTMAFNQKFIECGKVLLTYDSLKHSVPAVIPQRIFFLHDEFTHLPSFPRKSLETCFGMYNGPMGCELQAMDAMHKHLWAKLMADMFEKMENAFMFGDLHLFINVINGVVLMHCEDVIILRRCMATYISMAVHFNTLFATQGFFLIMPTILRCYSHHQTNGLLCRAVEFVCKQFYILHRKPFFLQMAGAVANILDNNDSDFEVYPTKVKAKYWFNLLKRMEEMSDLDDPMDILGLVNEPKPLKALDLCYRDDPNTFSILTDGLASCVTVCAYAPDSRRSYQMLLVMQAIIPYFIDACEKDTVDQMNSAASVKHEVNIYTTLCVEMKALVNSCEILARGPTRTFDIVNTVTERGKSFIADSPQFFDPPTIIEEDVKLQYSSSNKDKKNPSGWEGVDNSEVQREVFRRPRDALLVLSATFIEKGAPRLKELSKLAASLEHTKLPELFDHKCHVKLSEMALALLKVAPYDSNTLGCLGLQKYFVSILPITDWSVEGNRSALNIILRRLDKTIQKIGKRLSLRRRTNWNALSSWLNGLYSTLMAYPYIAHLHPLKTITQMCLRIMVGDPCSEDGSSQSASHSITLSTILHSSTPPASFCNAVLRLASFLMQALGQFCFSLELMCSAEGIGPTAERLEAVLCHILIPVCLRCATAQKDTSHFQQRDIAFCLQLMHNAINPPLTKQCLGPAGSGNLAASIMRGSTSHVADISGRQSSVSVTDRGHSATVSTHRIVRETVCQAIFLALKVMMVVFHKQMTSHWSRIARIVRDLYGKKVGGASLFSFIDFILDSNLPISLVILPILQTKMNQKPSSEYEAVWQTEFKARIEKHGRYSRGGIKSIHTILNELSLELQTLKDDFATRPMEVARSHTPTMTELHSDSGSIHSVSAPRLSASKSIGEPRRLSSQALNRLSRLTPNFYKGTNNEATLEGTIIEDTEDESSQSKQTRVMKISSLPTTRSTCHSFSGRIGMWRSMRRKSRACSADSESGPSRPRSSVEMGEIPPIGHHRRTRSCSRRFPLVEDSVAIALNVEQPLAAAHLIVPNESDERLKTVSFSTPKRVRNEMSVGHFDRLSQRLNIDDSTDRITARHHYV